MSKTKFCKDCRYFFYNYFLKKISCLNKKIPYKKDLVYGKYYDSDMACEDARENEDLCGKNAKWYIEKY